MSSVVKLELGRTLLLDGPASARVLSGRVSIFGAEVGAGRRVLVRKGRRLPLEPLEPSELEVVMGRDGSFSLVEGSPIPSSWREAAEEALALSSRVKLMVLGGVDVGKTSLCTYLANMALKAGRSVGLVDADVGQSDIGPPCTIGFARITRPVADLASVRAEQVFFLGDKTPSYMVERALEGIKAMIKAAEDAGVEFLIVNTDGWISGRGAAEYKRAIAELLGPDMILALARGLELDEVLAVLEGWKVKRLEVSPFVRERDRETRRELRTLGYRRYLEGAKIITVQLDWVEVEGHLPGSGLRPSRERLATILSHLSSRPLYCEEGQEDITLVYDKEVPLPTPEELAALEQALGKKARVLVKGAEKDLLVALYDAEGHFLGIGTVVCVDYRKRAVRIYTPAEEKAVAKLCVGHIRVSQDGSELEALTQALAPAQEARA